MASNSSKTPPSSSKCKTYEDWLKLIKIWRKSSNVTANWQGPALVLSLEDEALDAVLEIDESDISKENGVDFIIERLNRLFKKDLTVVKYQTLKAFMTFKRPSNIWRISKSNYTWFSIRHHERSIKEDLQWCIKANSNKIRWDH